MNSECCSYIEFALGGDAAFVILNNFTYIGQSQAKTFNIVDITAWGTVEALKDLFEIFFFNPYSIVLDLDA